MPALRLRLRPCTGPAGAESRALLAFALGGGLAGERSMLLLHSVYLATTDSDREEYTGQYPSNPSLVAYPA